MMIDFPPLPTWDGLHPLIVHFPIAVLLIAPLFVILGGLLSRSVGRSFSIAALFLMLIGTAATFVAIETGEAAGELADRTPAVMQVLENHEELAERTRTVFVSLTAIFAVLLFFPAVLAREVSRRLILALHGLFLVFYMGGALLLINTAHNGGRLVHELGVHALISPPSEAAYYPPDSEREDEGDDLRLE